MFHEYREVIADLKKEDKHFDNLFKKHNRLDAEISELEKAHADQFEIEKQKKDKLKLKDEIYKLIIAYKKAKNL